MKGPAGVGAGQRCEMDNSRWYGGLRQLRNDLPPQRASCGGSGLLGAGGHATQETQTDDAVSHWNSRAEFTPRGPAWKGRSGVLVKLGFTLHNFCVAFRSVVV